MSIYFLIFFGMSQLLLISYLYSPSHFPHSETVFKQKDTSTLKKESLKQPLIDYIRYIFFQFLSSMINGDLF